MKVIRKLLTIGLAFIFIVCINGAFISCTNSGKYDVTIRIACDDGGTWVFTPDVDEIRIERNYDGQEHRYYVDAYQLPDHPRWGTMWLEPKGDGADIFHVHLAYRNESGQVVETKRISDRGEYCLHVNASRSSDLWNERTVLLYVMVI